MEIEIRTHKDILNIIVAERLSRNMSVEEAAEQLGMTADVYNNYECGRTALKINHMMGIFNLFGIELIAVV